MWHQCARKRMQKGGGGNDDDDDDDDKCCAPERERYRHSLAMPTASAIALALLMPLIEAAEARDEVQHTNVRVHLSHGVAPISWTSVKRAATILDPPLCANLLAFVSRCQTSEREVGLLTGTYYFPTNIGEPHIEAVRIASVPLDATAGYVECFPTWLQSSHVYIRRVLTDIENDDKDSEW